MVGELLMVGELGDEHMRDGALGRQAGFPAPESFCHSRAERLQGPHPPPVQPGEQRLELGAVQGHRPGLARGCAQEAEPD